MKPRYLLSAAELADLQVALDTKLDRIGLVSQPEVVIKLLGLVSNPKSEILDYAGVIRADHAVSGRVLRLANSAFFAQRKAVTTIDRACLVLGLERLKAVSLGFHMSRAAGGSAHTISRAVWGQSLLRAYMASEMAKLTAPQLTAQAFIVGLMADAGVPLMVRLLGEPYVRLYNEGHAPGGLFRRESELLPFTHVDVVVALARRWRFPSLLSMPMEWHHSRPKPVPGAAEEPAQRLHRLAYTVGLIDLGKNQSAPLESATPALPTAERLLGVNTVDMGRAVTRAVSEFSLTFEMFSEIADEPADLEALVEQVQGDVIALIDRYVEQSIAADEQTGAARIVVRGQTIEVQRDTDGTLVAYLYDSHGQRLVTHRLEKARGEEQALAEAFGFDGLTADEVQRIGSYLETRAA